MEVIDVSAHEPRRIPSEEVARVDQEGVGCRPAAVPEVLTGNAHRFAHRGVLRQLKRPAAPECASRTPCSAAPSPPAAAVFDFRAHFCHSAPVETQFPLSKSNFLSV